jgi:hypothetical protein
LGEAGPVDGGAVGADVAALQHQPRHPIPSRGGVGEHRQPPAEIGADVRLALAHHPGRDHAACAQGKPGLPRDVRGDGGGEGAVPRVAGGAVGAGVRGEGAQAVAIRHDREHARGVGGIAFEVDIEHQVERALPVQQHHPSRDGIERAIEPVVGGAVVVLERNDVVSGGAQGKGHGGGDRGGAGRLGGVATAGVAVTLDDDDAERCGGHGRNSLKRAGCGLGERSL